MYGTNSIFVVKYIFPKYLPEFINSESLPPTPQTVSCMQRRMVRRAYNTEGERVSPPPPPGRLAGYLNLAAVHSLERELSLLLINSGKYLGKIYFTTKILFFIPLLCSVTPWVLVILWGKVLSIGIYNSLSLTMTPFLFPFSRGLLFSFSSS